MSSALARPISYLDTEVRNFITAHAQASNEDNKRSCRIMFSSYLSKNQYTAKEAADAIRRYIDPHGLEHSEAWIDTLKRESVFDYEQSGSMTSTVRNNSFNQTHIQAPSTVLQPDKMESQLAIREPSSLATLQEHINTYTPANDVLRNLAKSKLSIYMAAPSGTGKTTLCRAIMLAIINIYPDTKFRVIDLQPNRWLGLEVDNKIVTHIATKEDEDMLLISEAIREVQEEFTKRRKEAMYAIKSHTKRKVNYPYVFFFNEWNSFFDWTKRYDASRIKKYRKLALDRGIQDPIIPKDIPFIVADLLGTGRDSSIKLVLCGQDYTDKFSGLGVSSLRNANIVSIGRVSDESDGGYGGTVSLLNNPSRIESETNRAILKAQHSLYESQNTPVIVTSQGRGDISPLPDTVFLEERSIVGSYQHGPVTNSFI